MLNGAVSKIQPFEEISKPIFLVIFDKNGEIKYTPRKEIAKSNTAYSPIRNCLMVSIVFMFPSFFLPSVLFLRHVTKCCWTDIVPPYMREISSVGIIGYGFAGQLHAEVISSLSSQLEISVTDKDPQKLRHASKNNLHACATVDALLQKKPDAIITAIPPSENLKMVERILQIHPHVQGLLLEKPLALTASVASKINSMIESAGVLGMIGLTGHGFHPEFLRAKEVIQSGVLGQILECNEHIYQGGPDFPSHYMTREYGGAIFELGIHTIDHLFYLFDIENWKVTDADHGNPHWGSTASDWCRASLQGADSTGNTISSQVSWAFTRYQADLNRTNYSTTIVGTEGKMVIYGFDGLELSIFDGNESKVTSELFHPTKATGRERHIPGYQNEIEAFFSSVENQTPSPASLAYGVQVHKVLDAIISPIDL